MAFRCKSVEFGAAVYEAAQRVREEHGEEGYAKKWGEYPFPSRMVEMLRAGMKRWGHEI
jgi:hypothetical protein